MNADLHFTSVSVFTVASKRSIGKLKRLMRHPEAQAMEEDGWKMIVIPDEDE